MGMNDLQDQIEGCVRSRGECELTAALPMRSLDRRICRAGDLAMFSSHPVARNCSSRARWRATDIPSSRAGRIAIVMEVGQGVRWPQSVARNPVRRRVPSRTMETESVAPEPSSPRFGYCLIQKRTQNRGAWRGRQLRPRDAAVERRTAVNQSYLAGSTLAVLHGFDAVISDCAQ
jgi:hypothetical protein